MMKFLGERNGAELRCSRTQVYKLMNGEVRIEPLCHTLRLVGRR